MELIAETKSKQVQEDIKRKPGFRTGDVMIPMQSDLLILTE